MRLTPVHHPLQRDLWVTRNEKSKAMGVGRGRSSEIVVDARTRMVVVMVKWAGRRDGRLKKERRKIKGGGEGEGEQQARQPKSKMQIHSTNHYRWQASLLLKKRKEKPVYGPPARGFEGNSRSPEGEFTPHAVNACWCVLPPARLPRHALYVAIHR